MMTMIKKQWHRWRNTGLALGVVWSLGLWQLVISPLNRGIHERSVDLNASLAIAKAIAHGQVYMRDIFEQRGLYYYWWLTPVRWLGANGAYHWLWLVEMVSLTICWYLLKQVWQWYQPHRAAWGNWAATGVIAVWLVNQSLADPSIVASPDVWSLLPTVFVLTGWLYWLHQGETTGHYPLVKAQWLVLAGLALGYVANIKYACIGVIVGTFIAYGLWLIKQQRWLALVKAVSWSVLGLALSFVPLVLATALTHSTGVYLRRYFLDNAQSLAWPVGPGLVYYSGAGLLIIATMGPGLLLLTFNHEQRYWMRQWWWLMTLLWANVGILAIGRLGYAYAINLLAPLSVWGLTTVGSQNRWLKAGTKGQQALIRSLQGAVLVLVLGATVIVHGPTLPVDVRSGKDVQAHWDLQAVRNEPLAKQSRMVHQYGDGELITFGTISNTEYLLNNSYPTDFYFDQTTMSYERYPASADAQMQMLERAQPKWVVMSNPQLQGYRKITGHSPRANWQRLGQTLSKWMPMATVSAQYERFLAKEHRDEYQVVRLNHQVNRTLVPKALLEHYVLVDIATEPDSRAAQVDEPVSVRTLWLRKSDWRQLAGNRPRAKINVMQNER